MTLKIGVIGSGRIGRTVGELWAKAGQQVMFSSLDLEHDKAPAARVGAGARAGTPKEAAAFGEVLLISSRSRSGRWHGRRSSTPAQRSSARR